MSGYAWMLLSCNVAAVIILVAAVVKLVANFSAYGTGKLLAIVAALLLACLVCGLVAAPWQHLGTVAVVTALVVGVAAGALWGSSAYFCHHPVVVVGWGMMASALLALLVVPGVIISNAHFVIT